MDLNIHTSCLGIINVIRSDPELDVHKESYAVAKAAVIFLRSIFQSLAVLLNRVRQGKQKLPL